MIKKTNPMMFRITKKHRNRVKSFWCVPTNRLSKVILEDYKIRTFIESRPSCSGIEDVIICRKGDRVQVSIQSGQIGLIIGKQGAEIESIRKGVKKIIGSDNVWIEVSEVKNPHLSANIVAKMIAKQLRNRAKAVSVMREAEKNIMKAGAIGCKILISGRHGGADIARSEKRKSGNIPVQTLREDVQFAIARADTIYGVMGVKVWIAKGEFAVNAASTASSENHDKQ